MKTVVRMVVASAVFATHASANAADLQRMFELCLWDSFSMVAGARVDGPREVPKPASRSQERALSFHYELQIPKGIGAAGRRKLLDTFYYCLEGNGFSRSELLWVDGSIATFKAVRDDSVEGRVTYFEGLNVEMGSTQRSTISLEVPKR